MIDAKRLSAAEVVEKLRADDALHAKCNEGRYSYGDGINLGRSEAFAEAAELVEKHLVPQWQSEPTGDGWYWVDGFDDPCFIEASDDEKWSFTWFATSRTGCLHEPLNGRRVCPISVPPGDAKGGA